MKMKMLGFLFALLVGVVGIGSANAVSVWEVTYELNGGVITSSSQTNPATVENGEYAPYLYVDKTGYTFGGWYEDKDLTKPFDVYNTKITSNITLYAKWLKNYSIAYDLNGGSGKNGFVPYSQGFSMYEGFNSQIPTAAEIEGFIQAPYGKVFNGVEINGKKVAMGSDFTLTEDIVIKLLWIDKYTILSGASQTYVINSNKNIVIKANGNRNDITSIKVDNKVIPKTNYLLSSGSTILTLKPSYLNKLSVGTHTIEFVYNDGSVKTNLKVTSNSATSSSASKKNSVANAKSLSGDVTNPETSDNILTYFIAGIASLVMLIPGVIYTIRSGRA